MNKRTILLFITAVLFFSNCKNNTATQQSGATTQTVMPPKETKSKLTGVKIVNENDPVCDMPLLRGFEDTLTYNGKLIGFCSADCKDTFMKNPVKYTIK